MDSRLSILLLTQVDAMRHALSADHDTWQATDTDSVRRIVAAHGIDLAIVDLAMVSALPLLKALPGIEIILLGDPPSSVLDDSVMVLPGDVDANTICLLVEQIGLRRQYRSRWERDRKLLETITEQIPYPIYAKDRQGRKTFANRGDYAYLGASGPQDLLGRTDLDIFGPELGAETYADDLRVIQTGEPLLNREEIIPLPGGINAWFVTTKIPLTDDKGDVYGLVGVGLDITARKQAEQALRQQQNLLDRVFDILPVGLWVANDQGQLIRSNAAGRSIWGAEPLVGQSEYATFVARRLPSGEPIAPEDWALAHTINEGQVTLGEELEIDAFDGQVKTILNYTAPVKDDKGRIEAAVVVNLDITQRKRIEEALREGQQILEQAQAVAKLGSWVWHMPEDRLEWSREMYHLFGLDPETYTGALNQTVLDMVHPDDKHLVGTSTAAMLVEGKARPVEYRIVLPDGQIRHVWAQAGRLVEDDKGDPLALIGIMQDVTERKQAAEALRQSDDRYRTLFTNMVEGVFYQDVSGTYTEINQAGLDIFGLRREDLVGHDAWDLDLGYTDEHGVALAPAQQPASVALQTGQQVDRLVGVRNQRSGKVVLNHQTAIPQFEPGEPKPSSVFVTMRDVTERRRANRAIRDSEHRLRQLTSRQEALLAAIPDIVAEVDADLCVTWLNRSGLEFFGDDAVGQLASDFLVGADDDDAPANPLEGSTEDVVYLEVWERRVDGQERLLAWWCRTLVDENGRVSGAISTARDITDQRKLEEQYRQALKMESVGRLAGGVAHDFNNMLQVILGHAEMAIGELDEEHVIQEDLVEIQKAAQRSAGLTRQLLGFARQQTVRPEVLDLNECVSGTLRMLQRLIGEEINLVWKPGAGLGAVRMDPSQVDQILANLCVNARDAIDGIGEVLIETRHVDLDFEYCRVHSECQPGQYVMLTVSDTGCGMGPQVLEHLFEPFYTTKDIGKGTGLGLATVYGIVKQNGGFVNVYSEPGQGTTFRVYLPQLRIEPERDATPLPRPDVGGEETILIVEDEATILHLAQGALERQGYRVLKASTPGDALDLISQIPERIDLLVTDVVMPEMNGRELRDLVLAERPTVKTLFMSGYTADVVVHRGVIEEGLELLQKPFSIRDLAHKVRQVLDSDA